MTRSTLTLVIVLLFAGISAWAQQTTPAGTQQQDQNKPPVQPGQMAPPVQPATPAPQPATPSPTTQKPQPQTGQSEKPQGPDTRSAIRSRTNLVIVPVTVKNRDGQ